MVEIRLTKGYVAVVDDEDAHLARLNWKASISSGVVYARRTFWLGNGKYGSESLHRVILRAPPGVVVDHINGNGLDNRRANLRLASSAENSRNGRPRAANHSGFRGVCLKKGRWVAQISVDYQKRHLGLFETAEAAAHAYDASARELHGVFARLNFPDAPSLPSLPEYVFRGVVATEKRGTKYQLALAEEIRARRATGESRRSIAERFGMTVDTVKDVLQARRRWAPRDAPRAEDAEKARTG
jgi:hypothetical protein